MPRSSQPKDPRDEGPKRETAPRLKALRRGLDCTQAEMGEKIGVSDKAWQNYESGVRWIERLEAIRLCEKTHVTMDWIYRGNATLVPVEVQNIIREGHRLVAADRRKDRKK